LISESALEARDRDFNGNGVMPQTPLISGSKCLQSVCQRGLRVQKGFKGDFRKCNRAPVTLLFFAALLPAQAGIMVSQCKAKVTISFRKIVTNAMFGSYRVKRR